MSVTLGHNQDGKAETRVVRVIRASDPQETAASDIFGYPQDRHTTRQPTRDRVLATAIRGQRRHPKAEDPCWEKSYASAPFTMDEKFQPDGRVAQR